MRLSYRPLSLWRPITVMSQFSKMMTSEVAGNSSVKSGITNPDKASSRDDASAELSRGAFSYDRFFLNEVESKRQDHTYMFFKTINRRVGLLPYEVENSGNKQRIIVWSSNDYLGMSRHPKVISAARAALEQYGVGSGGARLMAGNTSIHQELEAEIAAFHQKDAALLFSAAYTANHSSLVTLGKHLPGVHIYSDAKNHASLIQGVVNSSAPRHIYRHNDFQHLEHLLKQTKIDTPKLVVFESVHSMDGGICPLNSLCDVSHKYGALTFVDEVHAVGLYGAHGAGIFEEECVHKRNIISGTFGKAFGAFGGYVDGTANTIDMIRSCAAGFIYTTSLPPTVLAGALASLKVIRSEEGAALRLRHQEGVKYLRERLTENGLPVLISSSHIIPIQVGNAALAWQITNDLMERYHHYVQCVTFPVVQLGTERLRITITPFHTYNMMDNLVESILEVWKLNGLKLD